MKLLNHNPPEENRMQSICFRIRHKLVMTPTSNSQEPTGGITPQPDSIGASRNHFQTTDNLNFFHKLGLEEVDEVYDEFESAPCITLLAARKRVRPRKYTEEVQAALILIWEAASRICSKRLVPFILEMVSIMEWSKHLLISAEVRAQLLSISSATVDRLLSPVRQDEKPVRLGTSKSGTLLKNEMAIGTFTE